MTRCPHQSCPERSQGGSIHRRREALARHLAYDHGYTNAQYMWAVYPWTPSEEYPAPTMPEGYAPVR